MTEGIWDWLRKSRSLLIRLCLLFVILCVGGYLLAPWLIADLAGLVPDGMLYQTAVGESLWARVCAGACPAAALTAWVILAWVTSKSGKKALGYSVLALFLFIAGAVFCRLVLLPGAVRMLVSLLKYEMHLSISGFVSFCLSMILLIGLMFEEPLAILALARIGILSPKVLKKQRGAVYLAALIVLAVLTPTQDAVTLLAAMLPFVLLYEGSILWLMLLSRKKKGEISDG